MTVSYHDAFTLAPHTTMAEAEALVDKFREVGSARLEGAVLTFDLEAPDLWELRGTLEDLRTEADMVSDWTPDRQKVTE